MIVWTVSILFPASIFFLLFKALGGVNELWKRRNEGREAA